MRVLLALPDLYKNTGGGQTVYRTIIETTPSIEFCYLRETEAEHQQRPSNTRTFPLLSRNALRLNTPPPHLDYERNALEEADAIARSVAGQSFDIVETPDFLTFGAALREACAYRGVKVGRFVLSMHGNISTSIELNWGSAGDRVLEYAVLEERQFATADGVYGISRSYIREWQDRVDREVQYIDPAHFVHAEMPRTQWEGAGKPSLYCVGRSERRKGNDLFIELVRWLNPTSYDKAEQIGPSDYSNGTSSTYLLESVARLRDLNVPHSPALSPGDLAKRYSQPAIVVLPTRYDTLNLVALEALFSGCPVAISSKAGVCHYLDDAHPHLPYLRLDLDDFYGNVGAMQDLVENYDSHRRALHEALLRDPPRPATPLDMERVYQGILDAPARSSSTRLETRPVDRSSARPKQNVSEASSAGATYEAEDVPSLGRRVARLIRSATPTEWKNHLRPLIRAPRRFLVDRLRQTGYFGDAQYFAMLADAHRVPNRLNNLGKRSERSQNELKDKLRGIYHDSSNLLFRCNFWLDLARVERLRGQDLMAATYELRLLRLLGEDRLGLVPRLVETLEEHGFSREAEGVLAQYADPAAAPERVHALLKERFEQLRHYNEKPWAVVDDRRMGAARVAVIVSLYKAADKLHFFLTALSRQSLVQRGEVEIILVDSGSPTDEKAAFEAFQAEHPLSMVYARSAGRETIQAAWNRGIKLATAPHLVFLGVDETLYPEALEVLADELDKHPETDWVMANSLVTAVDEHGLHKNDIMAYDRRGATKDHVYLETCYLSWVGGMYRKSIHDRFGYYDETFRGAGDTEFKNRLLPHINVRFVDSMLGLFLNYPDGQTTASPMAEIEDSRAWYLHRTAGGVRYAFDARPVEDAEALLRLCTGYRKSYCGHLSTDVEYGSLLADHVLSREPGSALATALAPGLHALVEQLRRLEFSPHTTSRRDAIGRMTRAWRTARSWQKEHERAPPELGVRAQYKLSNDNRYEQHSWLWKSV
ncbi:hypothetical protein VW23_001920 [Devosia insulae DS-56]|uniref:Glycosyltransferase 2-like domain-containing protein n=1 Tax=Devosia insulae DS-56 TaxID=1116389 RepID=A0A1E5XM55_9HYPH|nr:glycosyltransferase [Devosia insulae]OEO29672.1 hypothetical protein VW23_001920 [Devosia insulae DS-56]